MDANWSNRFEVILSKAPEQKALLDMCGDPAKFSEGHNLYPAVLGIWTMLSAKTKAPATRKVLSEAEIEKERTNAKIDTLRNWVDSEAPTFKNDRLRKGVLTNISKSFGEAEYSIYSFLQSEGSDLLDGVVSTIIAKGTKELMETLEKAGQKCSMRTKTLKDGREVSDSDFYRRSSDEMEGKGVYMSKMGKVEKVEFIRGVEQTKGRGYLGEWKGSNWVSVEVLKSSKDGSGAKQVKVKDMSMENPYWAGQGKCNCACEIKKLTNLCEQMVEKDGVTLRWEAIRGAGDDIYKACNAPVKADGKCSRHDRMTKQGKEVKVWTEGMLLGKEFVECEGQ